MKLFCWNGRMKWSPVCNAAGVFAVLLLVVTASSAQAQQVGTSISIDGALPNNNAMLDVQSPATGDGKGLLLPRITGNQRTIANAALAGGLLDDSGDLRGGPARGLTVYQTDGAQGIYYNTSATATPSWSYIDDPTEINKLQGDVSFISNNFMKVEPAGRTFGITAVAKNGNGLVFTHPTTNLYLLWHYTGASTSGVLTVSNASWFWADATITMTPQDHSMSAVSAANDLNIHRTLSVTNHTYSGGWTAMVIKEDYSGPGFRFEGCQYANGINGIVTYWH